jgi:hypothetical protein
MATVGCQYRPQRNTPYLSRSAGSLWLFHTAQEPAARPERAIIVEIGPHEMGTLRRQLVCANAGGRYQCDDSSAQGQTDHCCTLLNARLLDDPITDVVLRRCQFIEQAEAVLAQLATEYETVREDTRRRQRERRQLQHETETLQQNLALTRSPEQVAMIFEQIDRRQQRLAVVSDPGAAPDRRVLSAAQVATVRAFLADLRSGWGSQPASALHASAMRRSIGAVAITASRQC